MNYDPDLNYLDRGKNLKVKLKQINNEKKLYVTTIIKYVWGRNFRTKDVFKTWFRRKRYYINPWSFS